MFLHDDLGNFLSIPDLDPVEKSYHQPNAGEPKTNHGLEKSNLFSCPSEKKSTKPGLMIFGTIINKNLGNSALEINPLRHLLAFEDHFLCSIIVIHPLHNRLDPLPSLQSITRRFIVIIALQSETELSMVSNLL